MVVRNREARIRLEPPSASRSDRNGAQRRGEPFRVARQGGAQRIVRSIRLRTATKDRPENAAFVAPAVVFAFKPANRDPAARSDLHRRDAAAVVELASTLLAGNDNKPQ